MTLEIGLHETNTKQSAAVNRALEIKSPKIRTNKGFDTLITTMNDHVKSHIFILYAPIHTSSTHLPLSEILSCYAEEKDMQSTLS